MDEVFVKIGGQWRYLWRAVDQDGTEIDILVQNRRNGQAVRRFFRRVLGREGQLPLKLVTDKLGSYRVARREVTPEVPHKCGQYQNNISEASHQPTRRQERQ